MKRPEVYSWRLATELKAALEQEARRERATVGGLLERIALEWLSARRHVDAAKTVGTIAGGDPGRSTGVRAAVRHRLGARRCRRRVGLTARAKV